jgi:ferredoxin
MPEEFEVRFSGDSHPPLKLEEGTALSTALNASNSPVLFGCRIGICGTCVIEVSASDAQLAEAGPVEAESLELYAPGCKGARLACQLNATANICIGKLGGNGV